MSLLPTKVIEANIKNPRKLVLFSNTKVGKTTAVSALPNCLLIDLEDGSEFVNGLKINVKKIAKESGKSVLDILKEIHDELKKGEVKYDYIVLDTTTTMEELAVELATMLYKRTVQGKNFTGNNVVTQLEKGRGYELVREAFEKLYKMFEPYAEKCFILIGHVKLSSIDKAGIEASFNDIQLTGKLKTLICKDADSIGYLYRSKENTNHVMISFETKEDDIVTGSRCPHLRGKRMLLSERIVNGDEEKFVYHWDKIFLNQ